MITEREDLLIGTERNLVLQVSKGEEIGIGIQGFNKSEHDKKLVRS